MKMICCSNFVLLTIFLLASKRMGCSGKRPQKFTLKPDDTTIACKGDNVTLKWRYYHPSYFKLIEVFFGVWTNPVSAARLSLIAVNSSGFVQFRKENKSRLSWKGNITSSEAVFVLHNVQPEDGNKFFGIHVEFDLHYPLIDTLKLQVETKPPETEVPSAKPFTETTGDNEDVIHTSAGVAAVFLTGISFFLGWCYHKRCRTQMNTELSETAEILEPEEIASESSVKSVAC